MISSVWYPHGRWARCRIWRTMVNANAIKIVLTRFWQTMKTLLKSILLRKRKFPFTTSMGLNRKESMAGSSPETNETMPTSTSAKATAVPSPCSGMSVVSSSFIKGRRQQAMPHPSAKHANVKTNDSLIYRQRMPRCDSPSSRRVAISFALFPACATVRLI